MIRITLAVAEDRDVTAAVAISGGSTASFEGDAAAACDPVIARRHGNRHRDPMRPTGNPPLGRYRLAGRGKTPPDALREYGAELLLFEPSGGAALDAESFGRLALLVYAGPRGRDGRLRRTQGGVRFDAPVMDDLLARLGDGREAELRIEPVSKPAWWAFWRRARPAVPLSEDPPGFHAPPLDEATLAKGIERFVAPTRVARSDDDDDRWRTRDDGSRSSSPDGSTPARGGGGTGGGGGASAAWDAPGRGPGVDGSGRIVAAAGATALAATAAAAAASAASDGAPAPDLTSTHTSY